MNVPLKFFKYADRAISIYCVQHNHYRLGQCRPAEAPVPGSLDQWGVCD